MVLRNVAKTFSLEEQRQEINEIAIDLDSVNTTLTNYNGANWDTAYGWGDHAQAGYWVDNSTSRTNWDTAYGWGDHAQIGYLTSYTETDPVFSASAASGITSTKVTNWDAAYGWGDHSTAGYLTTVALNNLSDVTITSPSNGEVLSYNGSAWVNSTPSGGGGGANVTISDTAPGSASVGDLWWESDTGRLKIRYQDTDSTQWVDTNPPLSPSLSSNAPASASATGTAGDIRYDSNYVYICVATDTWKRAALATW